MARTRFIKPAFFRNQTLCECSPWARLLFIGLWTEADREGRLKDRPKQIEAELFPADDVDIEALLTELALSRFIIRYAIDAKPFI